MLLYHTPHTLLSHKVCTLNISRFKIRKKLSEGKKSEISKSEMAGVRKGYLRKCNTNVSW